MVHFLNDFSKHRDRHDTNHCGILHRIKLKIIDNETEKTFLSTYYLEKNQINYWLKYIFSLY